MAKIRHFTPATVMVFTIDLTADYDWSIWSFDAHVSGMLWIGERTYRVASSTGCVPKVSEVWRLYN